MIGLLWTPVHQAIASATGGVERSARPAAHIIQHAPRQGRALRARAERCAVASRCCMLYDERERSFHAVTKDYA